MNIKKFFAIGMGRNEIYSRIKNTIIAILIIMIVISFVAVFNLSAKLEESIIANNILIEYIGGE